MPKFIVKARRSSAAFIYFILFGRFVIATA